MKRTRVRRVVDTNVLVVANGRSNSNATASCRLKCIEALEQILDTESNLLAIVDEGMEIQAEYRRYCDPSGQPSVGDRFYQAVVQNYAGKIMRVTLSVDENGEYLDFPKDHRLANFDKSDRKFAAVAKKASAVVLNAVDMRSWPVYRAVLLELGIEVVELC